MIIPQYVQDLMKRSTYVYSNSRIMLDNPNYEIGYTIRIRKRTEYAKVETLQQEVERLVNWANREAGIETAYILSVPTKTHYCDQGAIVTILDPIMQRIEQYIPSKV